LPPSHARLGVGTGPVLAPVRLLLTTTPPPLTRAGRQARRPPPRAGVGRVGRPSGGASGCVLFLEGGESRWSTHILPFFPRFSISLISLTPSRLFPFPKGLPPPRPPLLRGAPNPGHTHTTTAPPPRAVPAPGPPLGPRACRPRRRARVGAGYDPARPAHPPAWLRRRARPVRRRPHPLPGHPDSA